jgi:hypothetical protein
MHAISEPGFMRRCRTLIDEVSRAGRVPRWQFPYIDDRIRVFEGRPQHFGTPFDLQVVQGIGRTWNTGGYEHPVFCGIAALAFAVTEFRRMEKSKAPHLRVPAVAC